MNGFDDMLDNISHKVHIIDIPIMRNIMLFSDLKVLFLLILIFKKNKFSMVHSVSPKAGLLCCISAWITRIPIRLHTFTGQVWLTKKGLFRWVLKLFDRLVVMLNTNILIDSFSQQNFLIEEGVLSSELSSVIGLGSISGVDINRFIPSMSQKKMIRNKFGIESNKIVLMFLGRLKREKGVIELAKAFNEVFKINKNIILFIVGQDEESLKQELQLILHSCSDSVRFIGFTKNPEQFMSASDIFVLPSFREGFGNVIIEAACCGVPSIASNIYGLNDAVIDGETGILTSVASKSSLKDAMIKLINDKKLRISMGKKARVRAINFFSQESITIAIVKLYKTLLK